MTVNDADEQAWLVDQFGGAEHFWIGFTDEGHTGTWIWTSGETPDYTNWYPGEPSNSGDTEHYALMNWTLPSKWNDGHVAAITVAILERTLSPTSTPTATATDTATPSDTPTATQTPTPTLVPTQPPMIYRALHLVSILNQDPYLPGD